MSQTYNNYLDSAKRVFEIEAEAISNLSKNLDDNFSKAVELILESKGKVIVLGVGKSGIIGKKITATLSSTGTPSLFLHPTEAYHGDFGVVESKDVVILISNSGESDEVLQTIPFFQRNGNRVIALSSNPESTLGKNSDLHLNISVEKEACPLQLAPTSSTTATLAMGDALSVALIDARNFQAEDFAQFHPGGSLGRRLLTKVGDVMAKENLPIIAKKTPITELIHTISKGGLGIAVITDSENSLLGIVTDGDIRRAMESNQKEFFNLKANDIMTLNPKTLSKDDKLSVAETIFQEDKIGAIIVTDNSKVIGVLKPFHL